MANCSHSLRVDTESPIAQCSGCTLLAEALREAVQSKDAAIQSLAAVEELWGESGRSILNEQWTPKPSPIAKSPQLAPSPTSKASTPRSSSSKSPSVKPKKKAPKTGSKAQVEQLLKARNTSTEELRATLANVWATHQQLQQRSVQVVAAFEEISGLWRKDSESLVHANRHPLLLAHC